MEMEVIPEYYTSLKKSVCLLLVGLFVEGGGGGGGVIAMITTTDTQKNKDTDTQTNKQTKTLKT